MSLYYMIHISYKNYISTLLLFYILNDMVDLT